MLNGKIKPLLFAITININPETFINMPIQGNITIRNKWKTFSANDQIHFIHWYFENKCSDHNCILFDSAFEPTSIGMQHCHALIQTDNLNNCISLQGAFCAVIDSKMSSIIKDRTFFLKYCSNKNGWIKYLHKKDPDQNPSKNFDHDYIPIYNMFLPH